MLDTCKELVARRGLLRAALSADAVSLIAAPRITGLAAAAPERTIIVMCDGFGLEYYDRGPMPTLKAWAAKGIFARVQAVMPTVTNCNNASICCGAWPSVHGVTGKFVFRSGDPNRRVHGGFAALSSLRRFSSGRGCTAFAPPF
jgi:Type I phosphodiesterase / nucleotide pyrophosphatase